MVQVSIMNDQVAYKLCLKISSEPEAQRRHLHGQRDQQEADECRQELRQILPFRQLILQQCQGDDLYLPQDGVDRQPELPKDQRQEDWRGHVQRPGLQASRGRQQ